MNNRVESLTRFIPVCTGNSEKLSCGITDLQVHPRVYGELPVVDLIMLILQGSSPCVRGTHMLDVSSGDLYRFIPVCTGNSTSRRSSGRNTEVHPRVYGELISGIFKFYTVIGSSPCVRGTPDAIRVTGEINRFIPVCTGNSFSIVDLTKSNQVHPRVYGELILQLPHLGTDHGSSPCVRGTHLPSGSGVVPSRFIPVCTGNS